MQIFYHDLEPLPASVTELFQATYLPLEELLPRSDFVTLHVNLSPVTRHMINAETLALMKPTAVLVNTSRGPVIDQAALAEALDAPLVTRDARLARARGHRAAVEVV